MSDISINYPHNMSKKKTAELVSKLAGDLGEKYGVDTKVSEGGVLFSGKGVNGKVELLENLLTINMKLGLFVRPMKSMIESGLHDILRSSIK